MLTLIMQGRIYLRVGKQISYEQTSSSLQGRVCSMFHRPALGWTVKESFSRAMMINRKCIWSLLLSIVNIEEMKREIPFLLFVPLQSYPFNPCNPCSIKKLRITFYQTNSAFSDNNPCNPCSRTYASSHIKAPQYSQRILSVFPFLVHNSLLGRHPSILVYILDYHYTLLWFVQSGA